MIARATKRLIHKGGKPALLGNDFCRAALCMATLGGGCTTKVCSGGQANTLGFRVLRCAECPNYDPCADAEWILDICASRSEDVALVFATSTGVYEIFDSGFGSPCVVSKQLTVPAGTSFQLAWVPRPGVPVTSSSGCSSTLNEIRALSARAKNDASVLYLTPFVTYSAIPGTQKVYGPPVESGTAIVVTPGTVATVQNIGLW